MKKRLFVLYILSLCGTIAFNGCNNKSQPSESEPLSESEISESIEESSEPQESEESFDTSDTSLKGVMAALEKLPHVKQVKVYTNRGSYKHVYTVLFEQYIDHNDPGAGVFRQTIQFGFNGYDAPNVMVTNGYGNSNPYYYPTYSTGENELAFLLGGNYLYVEHRYFGDSMPVEIDYDDNRCWKYLTTEQAAYDHHEIVTSFKKLFKGKWISTGMSKSGMTTHMFNYYHPGDVDLYVPYVAPFCNSIADERMIKFIYETAGDEQYGEETGQKYRNDVLEFQVKLLEYRDTLAPKFYQAAQSMGELTAFCTQDIAYDVALMEFAIGTWQYYHNFSDIEKFLKMAESTDKVDKAYTLLTSTVSPSDISYVSNYSPYYVQSYQELGNYGYDYTYLREAIKDNPNARLVITDEEGKDAYIKTILTEDMLKLERKELMYSKINNMLRTTDQQFIIIYGSSDPWYAVRPDDVTDRDNIRIYLDRKHPHSACIQNLPKETGQEVLSIVKSILGLE